MTTISPDHSEEIFYFIDHYGIRRVPYITTANDGRNGYALYASGAGNLTKNAVFVSDLKALVQEVVLRGMRVRAKPRGGQHDGQPNLVGLGRNKVRGYWLHPDHLDWVKGGVQPEVPVRMGATEPKSLPMPDAAPKMTRAPAPVRPAVTTSTPATVLTPLKPAPARFATPLATGPDTYYTKAPIHFADHCCQGKGTLEAGTFKLDDLTMVTEGRKRLRFSPLGNHPNHPLVALVGITPGGQIEKFASHLATMDVTAAASKAAFAEDRTQTVMKKLLSAHGLASHIGLTLDGNLNDNPNILTTSIVKCCLMADDNYKFEAPDIAASPVARYCATQRFVMELRSYPTLKWVIVFGKPGWDALHELQTDGQSIISDLRSSGLMVLKMPHFAQNQQQIGLYSLPEPEAKAVVCNKPHWAPYAPAAAEMRQATLKAIAVAS